MAITAVDKVKLNKYLKEHSIDNMHYVAMCDALGKRGKITKTEFLNCFTDLAIHELNKNIKISIIHLEKIITLVDVFLLQIHEESEEISEDTLNKIRNLEIFYDEYVEKMNIEIDQNLKDTYLKKIVNTVNELYPTEKTDESITKYINQINDLEKELKNLKKQLNNITKQYESAQTTIEHKNNKINLLSSNLTTSQNESKNKEKEITELRQLITTLNDKISNLEAIFDEIAQENVSLSQYKNNYETLSKEVQNLNKIIQEDLIEKQNAAQTKSKQLKIAELIYQKLLFENADLNQLLEFVQQNELTTDNIELFEILKSVKSKINIENNHFSINPTYKVTPTPILEHNTFALDIPKNCQYYDIMLVSDFHITEFDSKTLNNFDMLNEYCVKKGIHLILNLGDFFEGDNNKSFEYKTAIESYKLIEQTITHIPKVDGLYHAILGGNHDKKIIKYGFDPIKLLSDERPDIINLGYTHASVALNQNNKSLGNFNIHHPDTFALKLDVDEIDNDIENMNNYLNKTYQKQNKDRNSSYIDIIGHTHTNLFNFNDSYYLIPSFFKGANKKGACHLRIYFNKDTNIKYMLFMPLSKSGSLTPNNEIIYRKTKKL